MVSNVDVLGPGVLDAIATESNGTAIVTIQWNLIKDKVIVCSGANTLMNGLLSTGETGLLVKENQEKDKIGMKPDKNGKRGKAGKSQKQLQSRKKEKLKKMQVEGPKMQNSTSFINERRKERAKFVVQIILWYLDSGCSKHMTRDRSRLMNCVKKFIGTVRFENDHFGAIIGYGDYVIGDSVIFRVYYVEGLWHNLFSVRQFCDSDLEVAFRKHSSYVRDTDKYILVIVDDYSRFTWVKFLRSKDETPEVVIKFLQQIQVGLNKTVRYICTDNGTEFINNTLTEYYERIGIFHQKTIPRTPQQNEVVERQNRTLVEAARTMLIFSKASMFLWAEAVATACYTQNRSLIHTRHNKTSYELVHNKKPDLTFFRVFGALCYPTNDSEDLGKQQPIDDIGIFVGYAPSRKGPAPIFLTPGQIIQALVNSAGTPSSTAIDLDAPSSSISPSSSDLQSHQGVAAESTSMEDN
uniref:Integrase, catalytic region, zinc finger, CCHC-type, peptidase aspartic, catalytic n=1 Tax=Tanacetum cinerariifolium TaxID=118510 RepID=A0A6L2LLR2_TANCI|nr:integrase, catalytic region, zinc finger, CCHC-type, peptidase aspartic, catalytic [Tanacetum cinerariifolium]